MAPRPAGPFPSDSPAPAASRGPVAPTFDADPSFRMHPIAADAPLAHFRRVLAQLIAQEKGTALAA